MSNIKCSGDLGLVCSGLWLETSSMGVGVGAEILGGTGSQGEGSCLGSGGCSGNLASAVFCLYLGGFLFSLLQELPKE